MRTKAEQTNKHWPPINPHGPFGPIKSVLTVIKSAILFAAIFIYHPDAFGQQRTLTGRVTGEDGQGIPGVNVVIKGTALGTATDVDGRYAINLDVSTEVVLIFSFVGYKTEEITAGQRTVIDLQLKPGSTELQEIVVTGYSSIAKKDISSSISLVDVEDMTKIASSNFGEQLQGKVAGVQITTTSDPGSSQSIRIRGIGSVNNNEPLYVIDGVPVQNQANMNFLNSSDIESMQVLKDAAAASIYGARAANGVIVITTRKGKGQGKIKIDFYRGTQEITKTIETANPNEVLQIEKGLAEGAGKTFSSTFYLKDSNGNWTLPDYYVFNNGYKAGDPLVDPSKYFLNTAPTGDYSKNYPITKTNKSGTDWFKEMFRQASITNLQLSASGGSEKGNYYLSANYFDQKGIMIRNFYQRFQTRINSTINIKKNIRIGENLNIAYETNKGSLESGNFDGPGIFGVLRGEQAAPVYDINGYWALNTNRLSPNVVARQNRRVDGTRAYTLRLTGNVFGELDFLKNFTYKTNFGFDLSGGPNEYYAYTAPENGTLSRTNSLTLNWANNRSWVWSNTVNFNKSLGDHGISVLAGVEAREAFREGSSSSGSKLIYGDDPNYRTLNNTDPKTYSISSFKTESKMSSIFLNANYNFRDKYLITATVRRDGSSRFINNNYGTFPAASVAWRISKESFMKTFGLLTDLKIRASYGATGNNEVAGGDYPGYTSYGTSKDGSSYDINGTGNSIVPGFSKTSVGNPDLRWETSIVTNIAVDATLSKNLDLTVEWYERKTKDMIFPVTLPLQEGEFYQNQNIGSMMNKGVEIQLNYRGKALANAMHYTIGLTGTHYDNEVLALDANGNTFVDNGISRIGFITRTQAGYPVSQFRGYIVEGLWQSQSQINSELFEDPGDAKQGRMKFRDLNKDGKIDVNDRTFIGNPIPKLILGLNLTLNYKNFDFTAYLTGAYGRDVFDLAYYNTDFNSPFRVNPSKRMLYDAGKTLPVLDNTDSYSSQASTYYVQDASYTRLRNVVIGYTFPGSLTSRIGIQKARLYIQGQNLYTWTRYHGLDPEGSVSFVSQGNQPGRDYVTGVDNWDFGRYPPSRQYIVGINVEF